MPTIAYITPELTSLAETFACQEVAAVEAEGYRVLPFAVRHATYPARGAQELARRTIVLGDGPAWRRLLAGAVSAARLGAPARASLSMLWSDMRSVGLTDRRSWALPAQWLTAARVARSLLRARAQHIHAHFVDTPTQIAMYASAMTGIPFTCTAHANDLFRHGLLLREKAQRASKLLTVSHYNRQWLEQQGVDPRCIDVVRCASGIGTVPSPAARPRTGAYRIGTLCSLVERQGVDDLLRATALLLRSGCAPLRLLVAGDGPQRSRLQALADQLGIHAQVDFVATIAHHALAPWIGSLDLFVSAGKADHDGEGDGIPVALMEAMSLGIPVVATRISGVPELVIDGHTGYLAEPAQPESLAARIDQAMAEPERARAIGRSARTHVQREFGREVNLRRLLSHFAEPATSPAAADACLQPT